MRTDRTCTPPPGLAYQPEFISPVEERQLVSWIEQMNLRSVVMYGQLAKRTVKHFGYGYDFVTRRPTSEPPLAKELAVLITRVERLADLPPAAIVEALITSYPVGAGIG